MATTTMSTANATPHAAKGTSLAELADAGESTEEPETDATGESTEARSSEAVAASTSPTQRWQLRRPLGSTDFFTRSRRSSKAVPHTASCRLTQ